MPSGLREYVAAAFLSQAKEAPATRKGRDPYDNFTRNFHIALTVLQSCKAGISTYKNGQRNASLHAP